MSAEAREVRECCGEPMEFYPGEHGEPDVHSCLECGRDEQVAR